MILNNIKSAALTALILTAAAITAAVPAFAGGVPENSSSFSATSTSVTGGMSVVFAQEVSQPNGAEASQAGVVQNANSLNAAAQADDQGASATINASGYMFGETHSTETKFFGTSPVYSGFGEGAILLPPVTNPN